MPPPSGPRSWFPLRWMSGWSHLERSLLAILLVAPIVVLILRGRAGGTVAGVLGLAALAALQIIVQRHGGWRLLGPHFYYDVVRLARRGRSTILRILYIIAMFSGLAYVYETNTAVSVNDFARISERFAFTLFLVQNLAVMVLTPAYLGSAIAEERERHTLELLFTTQLSSTEIVLGKLFSRTIHLVGFVLAGFPLLSLVQFWGGIDLVLIAGNLANTLLNILTVGSLCLFFSSLAKTVAGAVMMSYAIILPIGACCMISLRGFPFVLQDARSGGAQNVTVQDIGALAIAHLVVTGTCVALAIVALREGEPFAPKPAGAQRLVKREPLPIGIAQRAGTESPAFSSAEVERERTAIQAEPVLKATKPAHATGPPRPSTARPVDPLDDFSIPYTLPPIPDNALLWKERFVGGPPLVLSPILMVPAIPFLATGLMVMIVFLAHSLSESRADYRRVVEMWSVVLRFFYYVFLGCYLISVAYRAVGTVVRERQQQTLVPLLLIPIERREILFAKWLGATWRTWPWLALMVGVVAIGTSIGAFHPLSGVLLCLGPVPLIWFFASLGLFISVNSTTVLRGNLALVVILIVFVAFTLSSAIWPSRLAYLETFSFSRWDTHLPDGYDFLVANGLMVMFVMFAVLFWKLALLRFENRARDLAT